MLRRPAMLFLSILLVTASAAAAPIPFDEKNWVLDGATLGTHLERDALMGKALLKGVILEDGIIEVDIAVTGTRSYPGVIFRRESEGNYERFYLRPHRAGLYPDALQYTPTFGGVEGWQLYHGEGFTAGASLPPDRWIHVKIAIAGNQARVYLDNQEMPALVIGELVRGEGKGSIGLMGPQDGSAYFSNFSYRAEDLEFGAREAKAPLPGTVTDWQLSQTIGAESINRERYPPFFKQFYTGWEPVTSDHRGLVDVARHRERGQSGADCVMAKSYVFTPEDMRVRLAFGYSDDVHIFHNGRPLFAGGSAYRSRDKSFLGIVGHNDMLFLDLQKGINEIFMMVTENFGGWGYKLRFEKILHPPKVDAGRLEKVWDTGKVLQTPESVLYDPEREVLYVTNYHLNYDRENRDPALFSGFLSKLSLDGEIEELRFVDKLEAPCGMVLSGGRLWVVERHSLAEIDVDAGSLVARYPIPRADFPNDITADGAGNLYITDTSSSQRIDSRILRFANGEFEVWLEGESVFAANGLYRDGDRLLFGNSGDANLKAVRLSDRSVSRVACLGSGVIDGIRVAQGGNILVSRWEGQAFMIAPNGEMTQILDTQAERLNCADFEFLSEQGLLLVPTFSGDRVIAYALSP